MATPQKPNETKYHTIHEELYEYLSAALNEEPKELTLEEKRQLALEAFQFIEELKNDPDVGDLVKQVLKQNGTELNHLEVLALEFTTRYMAHLTPKPWP